MSEATIPASREGYALDQATRTVHRRWARHARGLPRVKGVREVTTWLGPAPTVCLECWPELAPVPVRAVDPKPSRTRSSRSRRFEIETARALGELGFEPDRAADAVAAGDLSKLTDSIDREAEDMPETAPEEVEE